MPDVRDFFHQGDGCRLEGADVCCATGMGNNVSGYAYGYGVFVKVGCDDCPDSYDCPVCYMNIPNNFYAIAQVNPMSDGRVVKGMTFNIMSKSHKHSDREVAVDAYAAVGVDDNRTIVAYHQSGAYVCLPRNLKAVFDRIVSQGYTAE